MHVALTGAASGIGAAVLARLTDAGHRVTVFDIAEPEGAADWIAVDLSDMDAIKAAAARVDGPLDALINNAGLPPRAGNAALVLTVNVFGMVAMAEALIPKLSPGGAIVSTASRAGNDWAGNLAQVRALLALPGPEALAGFIVAQDIDPLRAYHLSKEAVIVWTMARTKALLGRGLRANTVSPAAVETGILKNFKAAMGDRATKGIAMAGRAGRPEEIADLIVFLAGPESGWIRGTDVTIDGGVSAMVAAEKLRFGAT